MQYEEVVETFEGEAWLEKVASPWTNAVLERDIWPWLLWPSFGATMQ